MVERLQALKDGHFLDFWRNDEPKCPHCGADYHVNDHEAWHLYEEGEHEVECHSCDLTYAVSTIITHSFSTDEQEDSHAD